MSPSNETSPGCGAMSKSLSVALAAGRISRDRNAKSITNGRSTTLPAAENSTNRESAAVTTARARVSANGSPAGHQALADLDLIAGLAVPLQLAQCLTAARLHERDQRLEQRALQRRHRQRRGFDVRESKEKALAVVPQVPHPRLPQRIVGGAPDDPAVGIQLDDAVAPFAIVVDGFLDREPAGVIRRNQVAEQPLEREVVGQHLDPGDVGAERGPRAAEDLRGRHGRLPIDAGDNDDEKQDRRGGCRAGGPHPPVHAPHRAQRRRAARRVPRASVEPRADRTAHRVGHRAGAGRFDEARGHPAAGLEPARAARALGGVRIAAGAPFTVRDRLQFVVR